jgi:hypothetical protein
MGKPIMHSARALFLTFLAPEKSKRNSTFYEDCPTAEKLCRSSETEAELRKFYLCDLCASALKNTISL